MTPGLRGRGRAFGVGDGEGATEAEAEVEVDIGVGVEVGVEVAVAVGVDIEVEVEGESGAAAELRDQLRVAITPAVATPATARSPITHVVRAPSLGRSRPPCGVATEMLLT